MENQAPEKDNQTPEKSLEELTNEVLGQEGIPQLNEGMRQPPVNISLDEEPVPEETPKEPEQTSVKTQSGQVSEDELKFLEEIRAIKEISGTPFKSPADLVRSYKDLQSQWTKDHEFVQKAKPLEQLIGDAISDPNLANLLQQAVVMYRNPQLASAYVNPTGRIDAPPDPRSYNMFDDPDLARYQKDQSDYNSRMIDARMNARFSSIEQNTKIEKMRTDLKNTFPDSNYQDLENWARSRGSDWTLVDAYKIREFDNIKTKSLEDARKELTQKLETASKTTTPTAAASPKNGVKAEDIISFIGKYGGEAARKKFGDKFYKEALQSTSEYF